MNGAFTVYYKLLELWFEIGKSHEFRKGAVHKGRLIFRGRLENLDTLWTSFMNSRKVNGDYFGILDH